MMNTFLSVITITLLFFLCNTTEVSAQQKKTDPDIKAISKDKTPAVYDTAGVLAVMARRSRAMQERNAEIHRLNYAPNAQWLNAFGVRITGPDSIITFLQGLYDDPGYKESVKIREDKPEITFIRPDVAVAHQYEELEAQRIRGILLNTRKIHITLVISKENGKWLIGNQVIMDEREVQKRAQITKDSTAIIQLLENDYATMGNWDIETHVANCTIDYLLVENGEIWNMEMERAHYSKNNHRKIDRKDYFNFKHVSITGDLAYAVYGLKSVIIEEGQTTNKVWNESVVFRREQGKWKIALIHSTPVLPVK
ncbi:DUF3828 domain-containing protein [Flavitalea sp.]|nr:nuclear transport factor 2 family protein [Flavitalea sp.]